MRELIAALVLCTLAGCSRAQRQSGFELFPRDEPFRAPLADPAAPRAFMSRLEVKRDAGEFSAALLGVGMDFGLLRRHGASPGEGWQLGLFGSADSLFNLDLPGDALVNTDYGFGVPLAWRRGALSMRTRAFHQSSHLGDELILGGNAPQRIDFSFEALDFLVGWERARWRVYGGGSRVVRSRTDRYDGAGVQAGWDYVGVPGSINQRLVAGMDLKWLERAHPHSAISAKAGVSFGRQSPERHGITLLLSFWRNSATAVPQCSSTSRARG